jgi:hypothetical protein
MRALVRRANDVQAGARQSCRVGAVLEGAGLDVN